MKKEKRTLVLALIGTVIGVAVLVVWFIVMAINTGFYSTKISLGTEEQASEAEYQLWTKFLTPTVTLQYDKYYSEDTDGNIIYQSAGITDLNYTDYKNITVGDALTKTARSEGKYNFDTNAKYYTLASQSYYIVDDITADNWTTYEETLFAVTINRTTSKPATVVSVEPSASAAFHPSSFNGVEIKFNYAVDADRTVEVVVSLDSKGTGSTTVNEFSITTSYSANFTVKSVSGQVVKK